jgi:hypothetical protein
MIIERTEGWGRLIYDTSQYRFFRFQTNGKLLRDAIPYAHEPVVLNVDFILLPIKERSPLRE